LQAGIPQAGGSGERPSKLAGGQGADTEGAIWGLRDPGIDLPWFSGMPACLYHLPGFDSLIYPGFGKSLAVFSMPNFS
jgi:hypothetical protein